MNCSIISKNTALMSVSLLGLLSFANPVNAAPVTVQTEANRSNASAGEFGANIASSALISILATNADGNPITNLGSSVGNGTAAITLPSGWSLLQGFSVPPGGCLVTPTQFTNWNNGVYTIRVVPFTSNASCKWLSGDYHYGVKISVPVSTITYNGSGLGVLKIP
ncbi:MAG TPA: hypothetical protein V6D15_21660 [Oculatellaceae cyanobacterium]|jgi:hypothetical protein